MSFGALAQGIGSLIGGVNSMFQGTPGQAVPIWELVNSLVNQTGTTDTTSNAQLQEVINQLQQQSSNTNTSEQQNQNVAGTQTTQNLSTDQEAMLNQLLSELSGRVSAGSQFSQSNAISASNDAMQAAIDKVLQTGIGEVAAQGTNFGAYSGTTQGKLAGQLGAEAAKAGAQTRLDTMTNFGNLQNQEFNSLQSAINSLFNNAVAAGGTTTNDQTVTGTTTGNTTGTTNTSTTGTNTSNQTSSQNTDTKTTTESVTETDREYDEVGGESSLWDKLSGGDILRGSALGVMGNSIRGLF